MADPRAWLRTLSHAFRPRLRPSLVIIGAQKAGTSSLFNILSFHPRVLRPVRKEIHHYDREESFSLGKRHYLGHFPVVPLKGSGFRTLEASPSYLYYHERTAPRIAADLPDVRLVAILRDPVKRAYSAWNMYRSFLEKPHPFLPVRGETRSFAQAVEDELAGRTTELDRNYLARGCYRDQLAGFFRHFPREQVQVFSFKELVRDPHGLAAQVFTAWGLDPLPADHKAWRVRSNARTYTDPLDPGLAAELHRHFAPELVRLEELLGHPLDLLEA